jgi:hypothetical protein
MLGAGRVTTSCRSQDRASAVLGHAFALRDRGLNGFETWVLLAHGSARDLGDDGAHRLIGGIDLGLLVDGRRVLLGE